LGVTTVVDENGILLGIITDGDLRRLLEKDVDLTKLTANEMLTKNPKTISKEKLASQALGLMEKYNITSLIILENEKPIGMLHLHDLVKLGLQSNEK
jgi:arabinose-5-phosphate isomerase